MIDYQNKSIMLSNLSIVMYGLADKALRTEPDLTNRSEEDANFIMDQWKNSIQQYYDKAKYAQYRALIAACKVDINQGRRLFKQNENWLKEEGVYDHAAAELKSFHQLKKSA